MTVLWWCYDSVLTMQLQCHDRSFPVVVWSHLIAMVWHKILLWHQLWQPLWQCYDNNDNVMIVLRQWNDTLLIVPWKILICASTESYHCNADSFVTFFLTVIRRCYCYDMTVLYDSAIWQLISTLYSAIIVLYDSSSVYYIVLWQCYMTAHQYII